MTSPSYTRDTGEPVTVTQVDDAARKAFQDQVDATADPQLSAAFPIQKKRHRSMQARARTGIAMVDPVLIDFRAFLLELGPIPDPKCTVDRINNDNPRYEPGNIRWATPQEQANNRSNTVHLTIDGDTLPLTTWAKRSGERANTIRQRLTRGASHVEAVYPSRGAKAAPLDISTEDAPSDASTSAAHQWHSLGCTPANWEPYYRNWWSGFANGDPLATRALFAAYICRNAIVAPPGWDEAVRGPFAVPTTESQLKGVMIKALNLLSPAEINYLHVLRQNRHRPTSPRDAADLARSINSDRRPNRSRRTPR